MSGDPSPATATASGTGTGTGTDADRGFAIDNVIETDVDRDTQGTLSITVRYFAGAASAAGRQEEIVAVAAGSMVGQLLERLADQHGSALARVLDASSYLLGEVHAEPTDAIHEASTLDVLPPFAGG